MSFTKPAALLSLLLTVLAAGCSNDESAQPVAESAAKYSAEELALWKEFRSRHETIVNTLSSQSPSTPEEARRRLAELKNNSPQLFSNVASSHPITVVDPDIMFQTDQSEFYSLLLAHSWFDTYGVAGFADGHVERTRDRMWFDAVVKAGKGSLQAGPNGLGSVRGTIPGSTR